MHNLTWKLSTPKSPESSRILFYYGPNIIHSGALDKRHEARIVYWAVVNLNLTINQARNLWKKMVVKDGLPPYVKPVLGYIPERAKFCECGHFYYEHFTPGPSPELSLNNQFGSYLNGCLKCSCSKFSQVVREVSSSK